MQYRELAMPNTDVMRAIYEEAKLRTEKGLPTYRHTILIAMWNTAVAAGGKVPVGVKSPADLYDELSDTTAARILRSIEHHVGLRLDDLMGGEDTPEREAKRQLYRGALLGWWVSVQSTTFSDTPNYYCPTEDLLYALAATNLEGVTSADIKLPHPAIYIEFPKGALRAQLYGKWMDVPCIGVSIADTNEDVVMVPSGRNLYLDVLLYDPDMPFGRIFDFFDMANPDTPLDQLVERHKAELVSDGDPANHLRVFGHEDVQFFGNRRAFNMVLGFLLYLQQNKATLSHAPTKKVKGKQRPAKLAKAEAKRVLSANSWISGTSCKIDPEVKEAIRGGWSVNRTHSSVVAGHYRRYRVGPRDDWEYEVKWIKPHKRGSKGPILGHSYEGGKGG